MEHFCKLDSLRGAVNGEVNLAEKKVLWKTILQSQGLDCPLEEPTGCLELLDPTVRDLQLGATKQFQNMRTKADLLMCLLRFS